MMNKIFNNEHPERKKIAILIDPDKQSNGRLAGIIEKAKANDVDYIFVGGSLITNNNLDSCIETIKSNCEIPVILFPGHVSQISKHADATLFLSLISGRNADLLIGQQVIAAPLLKEVGTKILPTGYMIIESGAGVTDFFAWCAAFRDSSLFLFRRRVYRVVFYRLRVQFRISPSCHSNRVLSPRSCGLFGLSWWRFC